MVKVAVIGAGVNGLAAALKIKESFKDVEVVVISKEFTPNTTGDGSGGLWYPYLIGSTPKQSIFKWGYETYKLYHKLWLEGGFNVSLVPMNYLFKEKTAQRPDWADVVFGFNLLNEGQLKYYGKLYKSEYGSGTTFSSFVVHSPTILKYLSERFLRANGKFLRAEVTSLRDPLLDDYDVVVNCSALGSRSIVPDSAVFPIRGQILKVKAPWVSEVVIEEDSGIYIIPNYETCILGGTHQENDFNTNEDKADTEYILNGCTRIKPGLKDAQLVRTWVGLRPGRHEVRLEAEERDGKLFIHNYGHGGSGLTLFWGCADEVLEVLKKKLPTNLKSKL